MTRPVLDDGDNIWHIERMANESEPVHYTGNETPDDVNDAFLIP